MSWSRPWKRPSPICWLPCCCKNNALFEQFGIAEDAFYLIRPDNYIAFRSQPAQVSSLLDYLQQTLGVPIPAPEEAEDLDDLFDPAFD